MSPRRADARLDAARLLQRLIEPCTQQPNADHGWRRCGHCLAVQQVQDHDPLALRLLQLALDAVAKGT